MFDSGEVEVDTTQICTEKQLKLRTSAGTILLFYLDVFESETPYVMIFVLKNTDYSIRMDIQKEDLAKELRLWLEGKIIRNPSVVSTSRIEGIMQQFVKFGRTPKQEDLIMWILSRAELCWGDDPSIIFGGLAMNRGNSSGDRLSVDRLVGNRSNSDSPFNRNEYPRTVEAALKNRTRNNDRGDDGGGVFASNGFNDIFTSTTKDPPPPPYQSRKSATGPKLSQSQSVDYSNDEDMRTFELTRRLLGKG
jgi:hypothetical protein